jgi:hypothetical protein
MALPISVRAAQSLDKIKKQPSIVLKIDGVTELFGAFQILRYVKIGDAGLVIDGSWKIGEKIEAAAQITAITFGSDGGSTTSKIDYKLNPDLALGDSVTTFQVVLVDNKANEILSLVGATEFLARKCRILMSPDPTDTVYPADYITIFRGIIDDITVGVGTINLTISHPDQKKRQTLFTSFEGSSNEAIDISETTITLSSTSGLLDQITGPSGAEDTTLKTYIRVNDEIIRYTGISGNDLTGCSRAQLDTTAATHADGDAVKSFYQLDGNVIDIALKLMLSGWNGPFVTGVDVTNFNYINDTDTVANSMFFSGVDVKEDYGLTVGDYITTTGASNGANNVSLKLIASIVVSETGSYITVSGVTFVDEASTAGTVSFRSKYDTFVEGLRMTPDEVDVAEHERIRSLFLSSATFNGYIKSSITSAKEFISKELYRPYAAYAVPRKARASVAYTVGPLPTDDIQTLSTDNVLNPDKIYKKRSLGRNFYNTIIYKYSQDALTDDFRAGAISVSATSKTQIPVGNKTLLIESVGLRSASIASSAATRRLNRYAFAADYINNIKVTMDVGYTIEVSDLVFLDGVSLKIPDVVNGTPTTSSKLYEVITKGFDLNTGVVTLGLTNTNFSGADLFGLISPASYVASGTSASSFTIKSSFSSIYGADEYLKWNALEDVYVRVRNSSYNTSATALVSSFTGNLVTLSNSLGFTPSANMLMELSSHSQATETVRLLYTHITNGSADFPDGTPPYLMV